MKPGSAPKLSRSKSQEAKQDITDLKKTQDKHNKRTSTPAKSLSGKVFYLDLPSSKQTEILEHDIKTLGGTVEKFFSKDIRYLVSNKPEARYAHRLAQDSPVPSPESPLSSPLPPSSREGQNSSSQGPTDRVQVSRGKSLVKKVVKEQERIQLNKMLSNALEWGVKVVHIDDMLAYIKKKSSVISLLLKTNPPVVKKNVKPLPNGRTSFSKHNASKIRKPFLKVEDTTRRYKPLYRHIAQMPVCNFTLPPPASPFQTEDKKPQTHKPAEHVAKGKRKGREGREKKAGGYCECCCVKYDRLQQHLSGEKHQAFIAGDHYKELDALIASLPWAITASDPKHQRVKCSIAISPVHVSIKRNRVEEAAKRLDEDDESGGRLSPIFGASCTPLRKRGREALSTADRSSFVEVPYPPESSRSKLDTMEWENGPMTSSAVADSSNLRPSDMAANAPDEPIEEPSRPEFSHLMRGKRTYERKRRNTSQSCLTGTDPTNSDTVGCVPASETAILSDSKKDEAKAGLIWEEVVLGHAFKVTQQDCVQKQANVTPKDHVQVRLEGDLDQDAVHVKPGQLKNTGQGSVNSRLSNARPQNTKEEKTVDSSSPTSEQIRLVRQRDMERNKISVAAEHVLCQTCVPVVSLPRLVSPERPIWSPADQRPHTDPCTSIITSPVDLLTTASGGFVSHLQRRRKRTTRRDRTDRNWRSRGALFSSQSPPAGELGVKKREETEEDEEMLAHQAAMELWKVFQDDDDSQEDFLGFVA